MFFEIASPLFFAHYTVMKKTILLGLLLTAALFQSGCNTYESDDGVIIRQGGGWFGSTEPQPAPMDTADLNG